jgi:hypothetical protein
MMVTWEKLAKVNIEVAQEIWFSLFLGDLEYYHNELIGLYNE